MTDRERAQVSIYCEVSGLLLPDDLCEAEVDSRLKVAGLSYTTDEAERHLARIEGALAQAFSNNAAEGFGLTADEKMEVWRRVVRMHGLAMYLSHAMPPPQPS